MKASGTSRVHVFVCTNRRRDDDALGPGCGVRGERVHAEIRAAIGRRGAWSKLWLATSGCLGVCPAIGCTVVVAPGGVIDEVDEGDAEAIVDAALARN